MIAKARLPDLLVREVARSKVERNLAAIRLTMRFTSSGWITSSAVVVVAATGLAFSGNDFDTRSAATYAAALAIIPVLIVTELRGSAVRGCGQVVIGQLPNILLKPASLIALLVAAILFNATLDAALAMQWHLLAAAIAQVFGLA